MFGSGDETALGRDSTPQKQGSSLLLKAWGDCLSQAEGRRGNLYHKSVGSSVSRAHKDIRIQMFLLKQEHV